MNSKIKKAKVARIIAHDATLEGAYYDGHGGYCVIGGLLKAVGYSMRKLAHVREDGVSYLPDDVFEVLRKEFGLTKKNCHRLQTVNDNETETLIRREQLLACLRKL